MTVDATSAVGMEPRMSGPHQGIPRSSEIVAEAHRADGGRFSFGDFIDVINPLQHIPGIAEVYRAVTNDQISDSARKTGNMLYGFALGGPIGVGAMLAYNSLSNGGQSSGAGSDGPALTADFSAPASALASGSSEVPVPEAKPEKTERPSGSDQSAAALLGEHVGAVSDKSSGPPLDLVTLLGGLSAPGPDKRETSATPDTAAASSVSYLDKVETGSDANPSAGSVIPSQDGLDRLATHQSNHLPLDVLKALQERHAARAAPERT
ncbi:hypothetical protein E1180_11905 [Roseibium denhamense]|uniref:Uncharacterized protein n=1 Tax=Roseibium denhamense TaxID=76305 RepID=A0ABY1PEM9_9HYPH|nr:hypothetical protein [Roseibium denhamense]MTI06218.1 hypothetical protein [Roseibium denhamense]SMP32681.1 hypothetical protein SAMN06265374_3573 [Roseibium denhamense]